MSLSKNRDIKLRSSLVNLYITLGDRYWENWGKCKRRRREAPIAEGKKPLATTESGGAS